jgi:beta-galactosidase
MASSLSMPPSAITSTPIAFAFRVWPRAAASRGAVSIFDPEGKTTAMLRALGYTVTPWNGRSSTRLLVIGRNALVGGTNCRAT